LLQLIDVRLSKAVKYRDDTVLVEVRQLGPPRASRLQGIVIILQRDQERASKTCAARTMRLHQYMTLTVQVTCH